MKFFVGIVPPPLISEHIIRIQKAFGDNRLEPHITIIPPTGLSDEYKWMHAIEQLANSISSFNVHLSTTGYFGKGVLFIDAKSEHLKMLRDQLSDITREFELKKPLNDEQRSFHAHLTLGRLWCGFTKEGFSEMEKQANNYLQNKINFSVEFLRIYRKAPANKSYEILKDILLKNK